MRKPTIDLFPFSRLPTERRLTAETKLFAILEPVEGAEALKAALTEAHAHDKALFDNEMRWRKRKQHRTEHGQRARVLDIELDQLIGALDASLAVQARLSSSRPQRAEQSAVMREALFPHGLGAITQARYSAQAHATTSLLETFDEQPPFQALASELGLAPVIEDIRRLNGEYQEEIDAARPPRFEDISLERRRGQVLFGTLITQILALHPTESAEDQQGRAALLDPIEHQYEALLVEYKERARRRSDDDDLDEADEDGDPLEETVAAPENEAA